MSTQADLDLSKHNVITDERVKKRKPLQRALLRPEIGALFGAIVIFVFFFIFSKKYFFIFISIVKKAYRN